MSSHPVFGRTPLFLRIEEKLGERWPLVVFLVPALAVLVFAQIYPLALSLLDSFRDWSLSRSPLVFKRLLRRVRTLHTR